MSLPEVRHGVWLADRKVGVLLQKRDHTRFVGSPDYWRDPDRPVLGLRFEEHPGEGVKAKLRLPPWFSNLLPEGRLREWIAQHRRVSPQREMELLAQVGHDLPGAVRVFPDSDELPAWALTNGSSTVAAPPLEPLAEGSPGPVRFSLAGVGLKFSLLQRGDRLVIPGSSDAGDWIVKLPDANHPRVPRNEYAMMRLAAAVGIEVPELRLCVRDELPGLPDAAWPNEEVEAYAIRRFDRAEHRSLVHVEDLAQVRGFYPEDKYHGSFETVGALLFRGRDTHALKEFARRLAFFVLVGNGDAHLKNWSLIYRNPRVPTLAPAYDIVSTAPYAARSGRTEDLGLSFGGSKEFKRVSLSSFEQLQKRLAAPQADLVATVVELVERVARAWPEHAPLLDEVPWLRDSVDRIIRERSVSLLRRG